MGKDRLFDTLWHWYILKMNLIVHRCPDQGSRDLYEAWITSWTGFGSSLQSETPDPWFLLHVCYRELVPIALMLKLIGRCFQSHSRQNRLPSPLRQKSDSRRLIAYISNLIYESSANHFQAFGKKLPPSDSARIIKNSKSSHESVREKKLTKLKLDLSH